MTLKLKIIIGSTRPGRVGPTIADWVAREAAQQDGFDTEVVDVASLNLPLLDEPEHPMKQAYIHDHTKRWSAIAAEADAFVFVTPEYDYFPPAALINAVQVLSREWNKKPAGVVSYGGVSGGLRAAQELRTLLGNLQVVALPQVVPVPFFSQHVKDGRFEPTDPMRQGAALMFGELAKWAAALKPMRG